MKKFFTEFKAFIKKGNILDLAVAVVIGSAFNKIVNSLVNDIIMPLISLMVGGKDVTDWKWVIQKAQYDANGNVLVAETALKYGIFIQAIIDFLIIALTVFIIVKIFKASTQKISVVSKNIIAEAKELTQKQVKALKKLHKKASKQAKKENKTVDEVLNEKTAEIQAITDDSENTETSDTKSNSETQPATEVVKEEQVKVDSNQPVNEEVNTTKNSTDATTEDNEMIALLREIRDSLKNKNNQ